MNDERRKAFVHRCNQLLDDHQKRFGQFKKSSFEDLHARIMSGLEDAFQMGYRETRYEPPARFDPDEP